MAVSMVIKKSLGRLALASCFSALILVLMPSFAGAASVGRLAYVHGAVVVERGAAREPAERGRLVYRNDIIVTGSGGRAKLVMSDGSRVYVGSRSRIEVSDYATRGNSLLSGAFNMFWGKARFFVNKLVTRNSRFQVRTSTAVLGVRGTSFLVDQPMPEGVGDSGAFSMSFEDFSRRYPVGSQVILLTGRIEVKLPSGKSIQLNAGQAAEIGKGGKIKIRKSKLYDDGTPVPDAKGPDGSSTQSDSRNDRNITPKPPSRRQKQAGGRNAMAGTAQGAGSGSGSAIGGAINNAKQNLGVTTKVNIQPQFVLP